MSSVLSVVNFSPTLKHHPLGARIPDGTHVVVVSIPTMADVIGYEEGREETSRYLKTGYPRFKRHPCVGRAAELFAESAGAAGRALFPVCSRRAAEDAREFSGAIDARIDDAPGGWFLLSIGAAEAEAALRAGRYLQHTGVQISSRRAEDWLVARGELAAAQPEELFAGDAEARILDVMAPYFAPAAKSDVTVCRAGMNAVHAAFLAAREVQRDRGRTIWLQLGWLYVDTPEILEEVPRPTG